ncbi:hypothetical protein BMR1_03g00500 [Babesia microti strain RI]|uniref:50S ribosomal protein L22 n=1 Tax=Babesia microti (strain RI) TaxID=1133968 RepID=A0A0K3AQH6_BABMR|nr:hypothetical protein BMR1_03g00500 [Babesia microti strain RI]CTQ40700.1 hypothetical protein BMR1_03g00500 [Babesia microti strain RI]|eukprot:XP_012648711.1 hypothetical protein BMR1_03g00500 [Babesia microti strain RI]
MLIYLLFVATAVAYDVSIFKLPNCINECQFKPRTYVAAPAVQRVIAKSMSNYDKIRLDACYAKEFGWKYRKRSRGGKLQPLDLRRTIKASVRNAAMSPIKMSRLLRQVKKMPVLVALGALSKQNRNKYALTLFKLIKSCLSNAVNKLLKDINVNSKYDEEVDFYENISKLIKEGNFAPKFRILSATNGGYRKKPTFAAKGRVNIIQSPLCHVFIEMEY